MPDDHTRTTLDSAISGEKASTLARELKNHEGRMAIKEVVSEYIASSHFADRVKSIQLESLESTETYKKISDKVQSQIDKTLSDRGLRTRNFIVPMIVASTGVVVAIVSIVVSVIFR